jgi:hypothetical protein
MPGFFAKRTHLESAHLAQEIPKSPALLMGFAGVKPVLSAFDAGSARAWGTALADLENANRYYTNLSIFWAWEQNRYTRVGDKRGYFVSGTHSPEACELWSTVMSAGSLTSVEARQNLSRVIPPEIADIFGHPPVLSTENRQAYDALMTQLVLEWKPRNIIWPAPGLDDTRLS